MQKKIKRGDPLASDGFVDYVKKVQNERGDPLEPKEFSKKVAQCRKKIERGDCSPVRFCRLPWKRFALNLPWPYLPDWAPWVVSGLFLKSGPISVRLKKKSHCYSRAFFLKRKTRRLKTHHRSWVYIERQEKQINIWSPWKDFLKGFSRGNLSITDTLSLPFLQIFLCELFRVLKLVHLHRQLGRWRLCFRQKLWRCQHLQKQSVSGPSQPPARRCQTSPLACPLFLNLLFSTCSPRFFACSIQTLKWSH